MAKRLTQAQQIAEAHNRQHPEDLEFPFKIVAPKYRLTPMRFSTKEEADEAFSVIKENVFAQAIYTHTVINKTVSTRIIGYYSGKFRKE